MKLHPWSFFSLEMDNKLSVQNGATNAPVTTSLTSPIAMACKLLPPAPISCNGQGCSSS